MKQTPPVAEVALATAGTDTPARPLSRAQRKAIAWQGKSCENCDIPLQGPFCHRCGQPERTPIRDLLALSNDALDYLFDVDSRVWRTLLSLFFAPGRLTEAYLAGKRMSFIRPMRIYLVMSALLFVVVNWTSDLNMRVTGDGDVQINGSAEDVVLPQLPAPPKPPDAGTGAMDPDAARRAEEVAAAQAEAAQALAQASEQIKAKAAAEENSGATVKEKKPINLTFAGDRPWHRQDNPLLLDWLPPAANEWMNDYIAVIKANLELVRDDPRRLGHSFLQVLPQSLFVLLPIFALLLKLVLITKRRLYMEHLMVAVHSHTFIYMGILVAIGLSKLAERWPAGWFNPWWFLMGVSIAWIPLNLFLTQKRVYRQRWWGAPFAFFVVGTLYLILVSFTVVAALVMSLVNL
ncbi:MAG: DUF3667 domain-containing protein [Lysobacterales bacterium]